MLVEVAGSGRVQYVEWPSEKKAIDIGSFYADSTKFKRTTGWSPAVTVREGLEKAVAFYRQHFDRYVDSNISGDPTDAPDSRASERV